MIFTNCRLQDSNIIQMIFFVGEIFTNKCVWPNNEPSTILWGPLQKDLFGIGIDFLFYFNYAVENDTN